MIEMSKIELVMPKHFTSRCMIYVLAVLCLMLPSCKSTDQGSAKLEAAAQRLEGATAVLVAINNELDAMLQLQNALIDSQPDDVAIQIRSSEFMKTELQRSYDSLLDQQSLLIGQQNQGGFEDEQAEILHQAKLEQAALGLEIISQEIERVEQKMAERIAQREEIVRLKNEINSLIRKRERAKQERDDARRDYQALLVTQPPSRQDN